ncbi:MAG: ABC transporter substrate-binding protein [Rikenellaceae bacterium]
MKLAKYILLSVVTFLVIACTNNSSTSLEEYNIELYKPTYAEGFKILKADNKVSTIIEVKNPWQGAKNVATRLFIARDGESAPQGFDGQIISSDAGRIVCMSSTQIAMLDAVKCADRVVGVSGIDYISNEYITSHKTSISDVGYEGNINYELLLSLNADLVLIYGLNGASTMESKLSELDIPYAYIGEYLEESPLGKAEWMVAVGEIVGKREEAEKHFLAIPKRYNELKAIASKIDASSKPKVMINTLYGDSWVMAPAGSYVAQLIADAGGDYIYSANNKTTRSESIDIEEAYLMASKADLWINLGMLNSLADLKSQFPKFADVPCVVRGEVYNSNKKLTPSGGNDYWESGVVNPDIVLRDLITIFHPELASDSLIYYKKLK